MHHKDVRLKSVQEHPKEQNHTKERKEESMKRILSLILCALMTVSTFAFTASASQGESPRVDGDTIVYDYKDFFSAFVNATVGTVDKAATFDGRTCIKVTPTPDSAASTVLTLDSYGLDKKKIPVPLPDYKYVGITYYYQTDKPSYDGKLWARYLSPMGCEADSQNNIVVNQWDEAVFNFSAMGGTAGDLKQLHFRPSVRQIPQLFFLRMLSTLTR